ncbi:hypothetical protein U9M48_019350 [Paspalum notatum var. saurae]|uniref:Uncharacterized protein n=1 Tax=Paspalum notatum var. saurae TaxID=547442 RepID=A0AAQ3WQU0_PASNO
MPPPPTARRADPARHPLHSVPPPPAASPSPAATRRRRRLHRPAPLFDVPRHSPPRPAAPLPATAPRRPSLAPIPGGPRRPLPVLLERRRPSWRSWGDASLSFSAAPSDQQRLTIFGGRAKPPKIDGLFSASSS